MLSLLVPWATPQSLQLSPRELVRTAIQNEQKDDSNKSVLFTWKQRKYRGAQSRVEQIVDTPAGAVSQVLLIDDKPLNAAQRAEDDEHIRKMTEPSQMRRKDKERRADDERTRRMLSTIPDAFDFTYSASTLAPNGHKLTRLKFVPRPGFAPPSREAMVFTGMEGELVVDETAGRLAKVNGTLVKDVNFGWGVLGKLYKGGHFVVEQSEVSPSHWDTTRMILHFEGKALLFKSIHIDDNETSWDFKAVQPMSVEQAVDFLHRREHPEQNASLLRP
ncbi:MAG: hypothetical protein CXZ00_06350 [Acidobacteria bacterium]|nr:MAG: hypothetical protein CXZ00_06350 [Acidobacteriota bacterium]